MLRPLILPSGSTSNSPPPPFSSLFYLHPTYRHPPFTILSPSLPISFFLSFFFLASPHPLHLPCICCLFISHSTPSIQLPPPPPPPPPPPQPVASIHRPERRLPCCQSLSPRADGGSRGSRRSGDGNPPTEPHTPPTPPHPTQKPVAGGGGGGGGGGGAQPLGTPVLLDPLFSVFVKPDFFFLFKKI